jgi:hypothetical protein
MGYVTVHSEPWGALFVDGHPFADQTPVYRAPIPSGRHRLTVYNPARKAYSRPREVTIRPGVLEVVGIEG